MERKELQLGKSRPDPVILRQAKNVEKLHVWLDFRGGIDQDFSTGTITPIYLR